MKSTLFKRLTAASLLALTLVGCGSEAKKEYVNYENADAKVSAEGGELISHSNMSYEEKTEVLGLLEAYAIKNNLTGLTLYEDGGYVMYNPRITKGTNDYIPGYGFGILSEGKITAPLEAEQNADWKEYYHTFETDNPGTINYQNDKGSVVGGLIGYVSSGYWGTKMNANKDGYEWINSLAKEKPQAQNLKDGMATIYKFEVKVGSELVYNTLSENAIAKAYAGTEVKLEDYLTPFKILHTKANAYARGAENLSGAASIKGLDKFYAATADGYNQEAWDENVGIKATVEDGKSYLTFEFNNACTPFYAMYYLASSLYAPVPQSFVDAIGGPAAWGSSTDAGLTPKDTFLSTAEYCIEAWDAQQLVFKRNPLFAVEEGKFNIKGIHVNILPGQKSDTETAFREFIAGKLDAVSIPQTKLEEFKNDPRTTTTVGSSTTKLNLNTCTQEEWDKLFGVNGTITQTRESEKWICEPIMSNDDFIRGLSYSLNRKEYAVNRGVTPSANYFGSAYMSDPENGMAYNNTKAHADAVSYLMEGAEETFGYNLTLAKSYFKKAADKLIADGVYKKGQTIKLEMAWMSEANIESTGKDIEKYFEDAFNGAETGLKLDIEHYACAVWSDVYYAKMMVGQFDIAFGGINGNTLNPLNFMEVLKSDNSSGFTLNWGTDTSIVSPELHWKGQDWSYDALWAVADSYAFVSKGAVADESSAYFDLALASSMHEEDGTRTLTFKVAEYLEEGYSVKLDSVTVGQQVGITDVVTEVYFDYVPDTDKEGNALGTGTLYVSVPKDLEDFYLENVKVVVNFTVNFPNKTKAETQRVFYVDFAKLVK